MRGVGAHLRSRAGEIGVDIVASEVADGKRSRSPGSDSLLKYAMARSRLAGSSLLENHAPWFSVFDKLQADLETAGKGCLSFSHYDYLGLAGDPRILSAAQTALTKHGTGVSASRLVGGERTIHRELEHEIASFVGLDAALVLVSGYLTNATVISHLLGAKDLVIYDELSHNSILQGIAASKAQRIAFAHNDLDSLERTLALARQSHAHCLIIVEGVYSMDGDIVDLPRLIEIKHKYDCWLLVDDAHAIGVLGATGRGTAEHYGIDPREIDLLVGTLSKSLVASGGFIAAHATIIRLLKYTLPGFAYSVGISPTEAAAALAALRILQAEPQRVRRLQALSQFFVREAKQRGLNVGDAAGFGVVPVMIAGISEVLQVSEILLDDGIYAPPILRVGVPRDKPRFRFFVSAAHSESDIVRVLDALVETLAAVAQPERRRAIR